MGIGRRARSDVSRTRIGVMGGVLLAATVLSGPGANGAEPPGVIPLPDGFQPEGIAIQGSDSFFVGSIPTGAIFAGDLRTGEGSVLVPGRAGRSAIGLSLRDGMLFVAGGATGRAHVYDAATGAERAILQLTTGATFINDVVVTADAAYFTDSVNPRLYRIPIEAHGDLGPPETLPLTGDLVYESGFNANGIDATPDGKTLVVVQSNTGEIFTVDPNTAATTEIDLGGEALRNGDGILLDGGRRLWVVQNRDNRVALVRLASDLGSGTIAGRFAHSTFDVPTTVARAGDRLAFVNARFGTSSPSTADYWVTQMRRPR